MRKQVQNTGIGTKSQQALKLQQEQLKTERKAVSREQREAEKQRQFELKQQKRKEKHRGIFPGDDVTLWCAAIDPVLDEHKYIVPGLPTRRRPPRAGSARVFS